MWVLLIDAEKAFDRVKWDFLLSVLEKIELGAFFLEWTKLLYTDQKDNEIYGSQVQQEKYPVRSLARLSALLCCLFW